MGFRIVIAGESLCSKFRECCLIADYLQKNLPNFCYNFIEKPVLEWKLWLYKINIKNKWHHQGSPIIWKELLHNSIKPVYIGGSSDFLDYCYSYYNFDVVLGPNQSDLLMKIIKQYKHRRLENLQPSKGEKDLTQESRDKIKEFVVTISGAGHILTMHLISCLLANENISKIYLYGDDDSIKACRCEAKIYNEFLDKQFSNSAPFHPGKTIKFVQKIGTALTSTDVLIVLDHVPFNNKIPIGAWLIKNREIMENLSYMINASASRSMCIIFPNLGPACYNATVLSNSVNIKPENIVVATSDLGLEIVPLLAETLEIPMRNIFCPPVWGFVGINHLVDIRSTVHKYNSFEPYNRYRRVRESTLQIGKLTPEMRTLDYLTTFNFNESKIWLKVAEMRKKYPSGQPIMNKSVAVTNLLRLWFFEPNPDQIVNLGITCTGAFGLKFNGIFSQPARLVNGQWIPATDFITPKQSEISLSYLEKIARLTFTLEIYDLPVIVRWNPIFHLKKGKKKSKAIVI